jgi:organic radical activating enzyme
MYRVNEIFYSIQGEGAHAGTPAVFIRFSGCNLSCPFCDTEFGKYKEMTAKDIANEVQRIGGNSKLVVITGGEPTLQYDDVLAKELQRIKRYIAMETNGTKQIRAEVDWVTISPKQAFVGEVGRPHLKYCNEVKVVYDGEHEPETFGIVAKYYFIQPCDTGDAEKNKAIIEACVNFIKANPKWRLSLQTQKIINVR